jgi:hypothetical protein
MNADEILEQIKQARWEFEEADREVTRARIKKDKKIKELSSILQELYKKNVELFKKLKECEEK